MSDVVLVDWVEAFPSRTVSPADAAEVGTEIEHADRVPKLWHAGGGEVGWRIAVR